MGGTFLYMAPECLVEFEQASRGSDIWSLGATYLEIFTKSVDSRQCQYRFIYTMLHNDVASRHEASSVVLSIETVEGPDLKSRYGYEW